MARFKLIKRDNQVTLIKCETVAELTKAICKMTEKRAHEYFVTDSEKPGIKYPAYTWWDEE